MWHWLASFIRPICCFAEVVYHEPAEKLAHKTSLKGSWPWSVARMPRQLGATSGPRS